MRQTNGFFGLIGLVFLTFAALAAFFTGGGGPFDALFIGVHFVVGLLALLAFLSSGVENLREFLGERSTRYGTSTVLASLLFIAILAMLNFLSTRYHHRVDMTEAGVFSLSPQSKSVIDGLDKDLIMEGFVERGANQDIETTLRSYGEASKRVTYKLIDPEQHPDLAEKYAIRQYNSVHLSYGDDATTVDDPSEENLTNAIIKLTRSAQPTVCIIEGHGEPPLDDSQDPRALGLAKKALENENYKVQNVLLASLESVPAECSAALVLGPERPFLDREREALDTYLRGGGHLLVTLAPQRGDDLLPLLASFGVRVGNDVVVDQVVRLFQGPALGLEPLVDDYDTTHEITRDLRGRTLVPLTRSVSADSGGRSGLQVTELVKTSPSSWAESDVAGVFQNGVATLDSSDHKGPVAIAVAAQMDLAEGGEAAKPGKARLVVFGSTQFLANQNVDGTFFNRDLFLNAVGWLTGQEDLLSIRPRSIRSSQVAFTPDEGAVIFYLSVLILPEILLLVGLYAWWRRE
jgi:ABC-type uncharacterized transport system involved in gliding motility auxiliary subunit